MTSGLALNAGEAQASSVSAPLLRQVSADYIWNLAAKRSATQRAPNIQNSMTGIS